MEECVAMMIVSYLLLSPLIRQYLGTSKLVSRFLLYLNSSSHMFSTSCNSLRSLFSARHCEAPMKSHRHNDQIYKSSASFPAIHVKCLQETQRCLPTPHGGSSTSIRFRLARRLATQEEGKAFPYKKQRKAEPAIPFLRL